MNILAGNSRICERVALMTGADRIPHALLLEGNEGTGRHTLASHIASAAVCSGSNKPCGNCRDCHLFSVGSHPDVRIVSPKKTQFTVDEIRALRQDSMTVPALAARKVYILERCESMNEAAQNAFLKVLEEPPAGVVFILLTVSAEKMLSTVRSRCITLSLCEPREEEAARYLEDNTDYSPEDILSALRKVKNNIGRALAVLRGEEKNSYAVTAIELIEMINGKSEYDMFSKLNSFSRDRGAAAAIFGELSERLAHLMREGCYTHIKEGLSRGQLVELYEITARLRENLENNANLTLLFANLCSEYKSVIR